MLIVAVLAPLVVIIEATAAVGWSALVIAHLAGPQYSLFGLDMLSRSRRRWTPRMAALAVYLAADALLPITVVTEIRSLG